MWEEEEETEEEMEEARQRPLKKKASMRHCGLVCRRKGARNLNPMS